MFYKVARIACALFLRVYYSMEIHCAEAVKTIKNGAIVCANHSTNLDPVLVGIAMKTPIKFMAKKELFSNVIRRYVLKLLGAFPVSRGENDIKSMKTAINVVKDGGILGLFPEGRRNITGEETEVKAGVGFIVAKTGVPVIPVTIHSNRKFRSKLIINIGEPIDFSEFEGRKLATEDYKQISNIIMQRIREK